MSRWLHSNLLSPVLLLGNSVDSLCVVLGVGRELQKPVVKISGHLFLDYRGEQDQLVQ
jgi:hypothetical protein